MRSLETIGSLLQSEGVIEAHVIRYIVIVYLDCRVYLRCQTVHVQVIRVAKVNAKKSFIASVKTLKVRKPR